MTTITTVETVKQDLAENMRPAHAARYLGCSRSFLDQARVEGTGPRFVKVSPTMVIYRRADLDAWLAERLVRSTSEASAIAGAVCERGH
jgi:predicted DNA-binding transcriptional regulator AlpA